MNVVKQSSILQGFIEYKLDADIYITIGSYGIRFSNDAVDSLNAPKYVRVLINDNTKQIAIEPSDHGQPFFTGATQVTFGSRKLLRRLLDLWDISKIPAGGIRIKGKYLDDLNILIFDLND